MIFPFVFPTLLTGASQMAFARALGEYGSGGFHLEQHVPMRTEISTHTDHRQTGAIRLYGGNL